MNPIVDKDVVLDLLERRPRTMSTRKIAEEAGLGKDWIDKLSQGVIENPGALRLRTLYEYLKPRVPRKRKKQ
jgi:hypothetical protein